MMRLKNKFRAAADNRGFTLVEILIAIGISGFVLAGLYTAFLGQQRSYFVNERLAEMQQNLRGAMLQMSREIRMAGYDPSGDAGTGILLAGPFRFQFTQDIAGNENVVYGFSNSIDENADGIADNGAGNLGRNTGGGFQGIAENIAAIGFAYGYDTDGATAWAVDTVDSGFLDTGLTFGVNTVSQDNSIQAVSYDRITAVRIWILARSSREGRSHFDSGPYVVGMNVVTPENRYYHRLLVTTIQLRNM